MISLCLSFPPANLQQIRPSASDLWGQLSLFALRIPSVGSCHVSSVSAHFPDMRQKPVSANWGNKATAANVSYSRRTHTHTHGTTGGWKYNSGRGNFFSCSIRFSIKEGIKWQQEAIFIVIGFYRLPNAQSIYTYHSDVVNKNAGIFPTLWWWT